MLSTIRSLVCFALCFPLISDGKSVEPLPINVVREALVQRIKSPNEIDVPERKIFSGYLLHRFYEARDFNPAWIEDNHPKQAVNDLLNALKQADREGLRPADYHVEAIETLLGSEAVSGLSAESAARLEILLTDAFLTYGSDLLSGRTNPYDVDDDWFAGRRTGDLPATLEKAFESGDIRNALRELLPTNPVYQRMRAALARYRQIAKNGGWPWVSEGKALKKGASDLRVILLRKRLFIEQDLNLKPNDNDLFDNALERGIKRFQSRYGLESDGVLGVDTFHALNVSVKDRIEQIRINMERCRWLPDHLGQKHIFVNVPSFTLQVFEDQLETKKMRVVVGRKMRQTPVFSSTMTHIVLNPSWSVPPMVARLDILDHIRKEPDYLVTNGFEVYENHGEGAAQIDPVQIDWSSVTAQNLRYKFRQKSGPQNALGRIKFMLPNRFDVYLHDTPSRSLFSKTVRDFSSGCIRVEKPVELASYVLGGSPRWPREKIESAINKNAEQVLALPDPIPVHLMYWTMWVDEQDNVQFRDDIYGRDASLIQAINREPSS